jgi:carbon starvation protein CstA
MPYENRYGDPKTSSIIEYSFIYKFSINCIIRGLFSYIAERGLSDYHKKGAVLFKYFVFFNQRYHKVCYMLLCIDLQVLFQKKNFKYKKI